MKRLKSTIFYMILGKIYMGNGTPCQQLVRSSERVRCHDREAAQGGGTILQQTSTSLHIRVIDLTTQRNFGQKGILKVTFICQAVP